MGGLYSELGRKTHEREDEWVQPCVMTLLFGLHSSPVRAPIYEKSVSMHCDLACYFLLRDFLMRMVFLSRYPALHYSSTSSRWVVLVLLRQGHERSSRLGLVLAEFCPHPETSTGAGNTS